MQLVENAARVGVGVGEGMGGRKHLVSEAAQRRGALEKLREK